MPTQLIRQARGGDSAAIERLLRLDPATVHDPRIAAWANAGAGPTRQQRADDVARWTGKGLNVRLSRSGVKLFFAGLISEVSEGINLRIDYVNASVRPSRVEVPAIRALFDAVHRDRYRGKGAAGPRPDRRLRCSGREIHPAVASPLGANVRPTEAGARTKVTTSNVRAHERRPGQSLGDDRSPELIALAGTPDGPRARALEE